MDKIDTDKKKLSLDKLAKLASKRVSNTWLKSAIDGERLVQVQVIKELNDKEKKKYNALPKMLFEVLNRAEVECPGKYISVSQISRCVNVSKEKEFSVCYNPVGLPLSLVAGVFFA